ncbi:MAG: hypothetical protein ACLPH3_11390 [Terracidiphilus sp.]
MKRKWIFFVAPPAAIILIALCGEIVMHLWNWLVPMLFAGHQITFWQSLGLLLLCRILFGSWGGGGSDRSRSRRCRSKHWDSMTPEEREKFRESMRARWAASGAPIGEGRMSEHKEPA